MEKIDYPNGIHLSYILPLKNWRILDLQSIFELSKFPGNFKAFKRIILNLESKNVIKSFQDPYSKRKYLHLTQDGETHVGAKEGQISVADETRLHDCKAIEICKAMLKLQTVKNIELEHQLANRSNFKTTYRVCPDALIYGERKGSKFKMAFELELTQKTKAKYIPKIDQYLESSAYDYALYFFHNPGVLESYKDNIREAHGDKAFGKIMLAHNSTLLSKTFEFIKTKIYFQNKEVDIEELFGKIN
ncbi:MAG: hypothetical protein A2X86_13015 [Bdellovibrionales bacterium GWA2_49_15]|nr:MAG: hypothetical protein A2X86_13015 [Bdellovibrionales bacterium GWA2_49_15]HAZ13906.1 hypothetical protein [Bdellovibrionales bacterium]